MTGVSVATASRSRNKTTGGASGSQRDKTHARLSGRLLSKAQGCVKSVSDVASHVGSASRRALKRAFPSLALVVMAQSP